MTPITVRQRLEDYEFTDGQEMTLTLELLNRIEKDIDELIAAKTRDGFSLYVAIGGIAATLYILLGELNKLNEISFSKIGVIFFALLLSIKIPWAFYQLIALDQTILQTSKPGRFFWSNDFFFENRLTGIFQLFIFLLSLVLIFFIALPLWVTVFTSLSFALYIFILGLVFVLSIKKEPYTPNVGNKAARAGLPLIFLVLTAVSVVGLIRQMRPPVGTETHPYVLSSLLIAAIFFIDLWIRLTTPSLLLEKLRGLRKDVIFLRTNLVDAWTRYEVYVDGHEMSEELRTDMDDIIKCFNTLDLHQAQKVEALAMIHKELQQLQTQQNPHQNNFAQLNKHRNQFFIHVDEMTRIYEYLNPRIDNVGKQVNKISRSTQEWQRADEHHQYILSRIARLTEQDKQLLQDGIEADEKLQKIQLSLISKGGKK